jgi:hypothetical protein
VYADHHLCFAVTLQDGWSTDGAPGAFVRVDFSGGDVIIASDAVSPPTLERIVDDVRAGALGSMIKEEHPFTLDGRPATWITFGGNAEFRYVVAAVAPDCDQEEGLAPLTIAAGGTADEKGFKLFLSQMHWLGDK